MVQCKYQSGLSGQASYHHLAWRLFGDRLPQEDIPRGNSFHPHTHMTPSDTIYQSLRNVINLLAHIFQQLSTSPRLTLISTTEVLVGSFSSIMHAMFTARCHDRHY
jgi:hypothetical protein